MAFADASAAVKRYADEAGSDRVRRLDALVASAVTRVEVPAALWRKHRMGELALADTQVLVDDFEADWFGSNEEQPVFIGLDVTPRLLDHAARLVAVHGLRASASVQLASALAASAAADDDLPFVCFDHDLSRAAAAEGLRDLP